VTNNYDQLKYLYDRANGEAWPYQPEILFLDFPKAFELTGIASNPGYGLNHFREFVNHREDHDRQFPLQQFVGDITNHDFMPPIANAYNHKLTLALSDFFGHIPTIIYHGDEETGRRKAMRAS